MRMFSHRSIRRLGITLAAALGTVSCDAEVFSPEYERVLAENAIMEFVSGHRDEWRVVVRGADAPAVLESGSSCATPGGSGLNALLLTHRNARMTVYLDCPIGPGATAAELAAALAFVVIDDLPHGIASPGWEYRVLTPSSHVFEGVTLDLSGGRLTVSIDTPLFAVDGHSTRPACVPPQDAESEPECYVQRPFAVPLRLTFSVPYTN